MNNRIQTYNVSMQSKSTHQMMIAICSLLLSVISPNAHSAETGSSHNLFYLNKINKKSFFVGRANLVTREGFSDTFFGYVDGNYRYVLSKPWAIEAGYRQAVLKLSNNQWRDEYRPMLSLYWRGKLGGGRFTNRHRIEWRTYNGAAQDRTRYRNESVWISNRTITNYQLVPFIEEEFFYDITSSDLNINWLTVGISKFWNKNKEGGIKWKLAYRLQSQKFNNEWQHRHMLVTGISIFSFN